MMDKMLDQDTWMSIRQLYLRKGKSKSWLAREFGISRNTVAKYLKEADPPRYRGAPRRTRPIFDKWEERVRYFLTEDQNAPRKQKHTAKRVFDRLVSENGFTGSERSVRRMVSEIRNKPARSTFLPLQFEPGKDAQVDFGESYVDIQGERTKIYCFEMRLNYSRNKFVMAVLAQNMETFLECHVKAFEFFGGVPSRLSYDNLGLAVIRVGKGKKRELTKKFKDLMGFYAFEVNFCTPGIEGAHEKGGVESGIGFSRRNWMVPVPKVSSVEEMNQYLLARCRQDNERTVRGQKVSIKEAFAVEQPLLLQLPERRFDSGVVRSNVFSDSYQTVIHESNRYSIPAKFIGKSITVKAYMNKIVLISGGNVIAEHPRKYESECYSLMPEHYLEQLERKPNAIPYARPMLQAGWPTGYWDYYKRLVRSRGSSEGDNTLFVF